MKNDNNECLKLKIDIQTEDDTNFLEFAILFDKPEFLQLLPQLRRNYKIDCLLNNEEYLEKINKLENKNDKINFSKYKKHKDLIRIAKSNQRDIETEMDMYQMLDTEANIICYIFKRPPCFVEAVKQAIFCGSVEGDFLGSTSVEIIESGLPLSASCFQLPQLAILVTPTTTYDTLKKSFQIAQTLYKTDPRLSFFQTRIDFVNNIRKYRYFYWERQQGKTYTKVADDWVKKQLPKEDITTYLEVMRGVKIYKKLLEK